MSRVVHLCASVRGMLCWDKRELKRSLQWITKEDGTRYQSVKELREALFDELAQGHEVMRTVKDCEGFDYKTGCPGHECQNSDEPSA